jgi:hypothetical protein
VCGHCEGADNFQEYYAPALGMAVSRMVADRLALHATPVWVHHTAAILNIDRDTLFVGLGGRLPTQGTTTTSTFTVPLSPVNEVPDITNADASSSGTNVHTALNPDGAIRGQLSDRTFDPGTAVPD